MGELSGWRRYGLAGLLGFLAASAMAPYYLLFFLITGFSGLVWLIDGASRHERPGKVAFWTGWWFAFGYFLLSLYWMAFSFMVHATGPGHLIALSVLGFTGVGGLAALIAAFYGAALTGAVRLWRDDWTRVLVLAIAWSVAEYIRGHVLTGLPWNLTGQALGGMAVLSQPAAWVGTYGLGFLVLIFAGLPAALVSRGEGAVRYWPLAATLAFIIAVPLAGFARLSLIETRVDDTVRIQIVQPNILQRDKINSDLYVDNFLTNLELSGGIDDLRPDEQLYVIWPENAAYYFFQTDPSALDVLEDKLPAGSVLMAGGTRFIQSGPDEYQYFNSMLVLADTPLPGEESLPEIDRMEGNDGWAVKLSYDKHHLAPFGEYIPFSWLLEAVGIGKIVPLGAPFTPGEGPQTLDLGRVSVSPIICYETVFAQDIYPRDDRPNLLVTVTNDAWFGDTAGPRQHFDMSRLRSIESGLPMARSANTGISAIIDPAGRIVQKIPLYARGTIEAQLPAAVRPTIYHYTGNIAYFILVSITAIWVITSYNTYGRSSGISQPTLRGAH